jgi:hypothetical protein
VVDPGINVQLLTSIPGSITFGVGGG